MRFGIATTVLVASQSTVFSVALDNDKVRRGGGSGVGFVSPSDFFNEQREFWSSSKKKTTETPNSNNVKRPQRIHQYQYQQRSRDIEARRELLKKRAERGLMVENRPLLNTYRENKNNDTKEQKKMECDPHALDTGILACGTGNYCKESQESSIGGICTHSIDEAAVLRNHVHDSRNLQQAFCSPEVSCPDGSFCNLASGEEGECEFCPCRYVTVDASSPSCFPCAKVPTLLTLTLLIASLNYSASLQYKSCLCLLQNWLRQHSGFPRMCFKLCGLHRYATIPMPGLIQRVPVLYLQHRNWWRR